MSSESNAGLRIVRVERPENFDEAIADAVKGGETVWVLIEGAASEAGKSWCALRAAPRDRQAHPASLRPSRPPRTGAPTARLRARL